MAEVMPAFIEKIPGGDVFKITWREKMFLESEIGELLQWPVQSIMWQYGSWLPAQHRH
jgi:hypothetical protein